MRMILIVLAGSAMSFCQSPSQNPALVRMERTTWRRGEGWQSVCILVTPDSRIRQEETFTGRTSKKPSGRVYIGHLRDDAFTQLQARAADPAFRATGFMEASGAQTEDMDVFRITVKRRDDEQIVGFYNARQRSSQKAVEPLWNWFNEIKKLRPEFVKGERPNSCVGIAAGEPALLAVPPLPDPNSY